MTQRTNNQQTADKSTSSRFSLDSWAVFLALGLSLLIWLGVIKHVPW